MAKLSIKPLADRAEACTFGRLDLNPGFWSPSDAATDGRAYVGIGKPNFFGKGDLGGLELLRALTLHVLLA